MLQKRLFWIVILALALVATGGGYFYYNNVYLAAQEPATEPVISTYTVSRGDLVLTASGAGTLVPAEEVGAAFESSGMLAEILVDVGDTVEAGQVLARLEDSDAQDQVAQAGIALRQAELELQTLVEAADPAEVAAAESSLSSAKAELTSLTSPPDDQELLAARQTLESAQEALDDLLALPDPDAVAAAKGDMTTAEMNVRTAQTAYDKIAWRADVGTSQEAADLWAATTAYEQARAAYQEALKGATASEIASARAQIAVARGDLNALLEDPDPDEVAAAEAKGTQAQGELDDLLSGASARDREAAELTVAQARLDLESARRALGNTDLLAPIAGTVVAVDAEAGEPVGATAIITLADLSAPQVQFWVEEADMSSIVPGNRVNVVFEALPDETFPGEILSVDPVLVKVDSTPAVQAYASVDLSAHPFTPVSGMNAEVTVVAGEALDAVLVPVEALRELGQDQYAVFVVQSNGELALRVVEVGLKDFVNAEIRSGLAAGEVISLGTETTSEPSGETPSDGEQPMPGPGMGPFFGG